MKKTAIFILASLVSMACHWSAQAQTDNSVDDNELSAVDPPYDAQADAIAQRLRADSLRIAELELRVQQLSQAQIDTSSTQINADVAVVADNNVAASPAAAPVVIKGDTLFFLYAEYSGQTAAERASMASEAMLKYSKDKSLKKDSIYAIHRQDCSDIMYGSKIIVTIPDLDVIDGSVNRQDLVDRYVLQLSDEMQSLRNGKSWVGFLKRLGLCAIVVIAQYLLFRLTNYLFRRLRRRIVRYKNKHIKPLVFREYVLLNVRQIGRILIFISNIVRYIVLLIQLTLSVPIIFAIFPQTKNFALQIFHYILEPVKMVLSSVANYVPNLFIIIVIWLCIKYLIKGVKYLAGEIENEKLKISGFYPDWAKPSFNIIRFLLYIFMVAMIYPYLPGSSSGIFQGLSVFVGLIVSLGSSTVIGNIIAGLVITYMRPFKLGDHIKLDDTVGNVIEKTPFVTRLRTPKNEVVTIPNSFIMSSHTVNYSSSARQYGLIIHTTVTIGYDAPWRMVHRLLITAARMTPGVLDDPEPFVLETGLSDYYPCYQINAFIKDADRKGPIMSDLLQNIQDVFNEAGVEIMSPQYVAKRDGNASTIPADPMKD